MITPEEFEEQLIEIDKIDDAEIAHQRADDLMCVLLELLGYSKGIEIFRKMPKYYI